MKYNKGFTLVELLAAIAIMAVLMVSAGIGIMTTLNNSKVNTFKNEVLTFMDSAENMYSAVSMDVYKYSQFIKASEDNTAVALCTTLPGLYANGYLEKDINTYAGVVVVEVPFNGGQPTVTAWVHNSTYGINGIERKMINRIRFNKSNNTAKMKRAVGGSEATTSAISGGPLGVVTNLSGLKQVIKQAYGKNDANIVGKPNGLTNGKKDANPRLSDITLYTERGGSGRRFKLVPCINTKMS